MPYDVAVLQPKRTLHRWRNVPLRYHRRFRMRGRQWMFHLAYELLEQESHWMGVRSLKNPLDAWIYQEILHETRPEVIVELGSAFGGSAMFLSQMADLLEADTQVVTVDHSHEKFAAEHPRITTVTGRTDAPDVIARVRELAQGKKTMVIHDASHQAADVLADLRAYGPLVSPGCYLIVEDSVQDYLAGIPGPLVAIKRYLAENPGFEVDDHRERYLFTYNPQGYLRRAA